MTPFQKINALPPVTDLDITIWRKMLGVSGLALAAFGRYNAGTVDTDLSFSGYIVLSAGERVAIAVRVAPALSTYQDQVLKQITDSFPATTGTYERESVWLTSPPVQIKISILPAAPRPLTTSLPSKNPAPVVYTLEQLFPGLSPAPALSSPPIGASSMPAAVPAPAVSQNAPSSASGPPGGAISSAPQSDNSGFLLTAAAGLLILLLAS